MLNISLHVRDGRTDPFSVLNRIRQLKAQALCGSQGVDQLSCAYSGETLVETGYHESIAPLGDERRHGLINLPCTELLGDCGAERWCHECGQLLAKRVFAYSRKLLCYHAHLYDLLTETVTGRVVKQQTYDEGHVVIGAH